MQITMKISDLVKSFKTPSGKIKVLNGINLELYKNMTYALMGRSGSGKSTLLHCMAGFLPPTTGSIILNGGESNTPISIGLMFQQPYMLHELTVLENIIIQALVQGKPYDTCKQQAYKMLQELNLHTYAQDYPGTLSGGQQQRVALLRALFNKPTIILADEPTGNLDQASSTQLIDLLLDWATRTQATVIVSTHDQHIAERMQKRFFLKDGILNKRA